MNLLHRILNILKFGLPIAGVLYVGGAIIHFLFGNTLWILIKVLFQVFISFLPKLLGLVAVILAIHYIRNHYSKATNNHEVKKAKSIASKVESKFKSQLSGLNNKQFDSRTYVTAKEVYMPLDEQPSFYQHELEALDRIKVPNIGPYESFIGDPNRLGQNFMRTELEDMLNKYGITLYTKEGFGQKLTNLSYNLKNAKEQTKMQYAVKNSGIRGEERTNKELGQYPDLWKNISNVRLEVNGQSVETDNILLSKKGIFLLEVKNFSESGSYSLEIRKDGQWVKVYRDGSVKPMEKDVTAQHNRHLALKGQFIKQKWKEIYGQEAPELLFHPVIVIANDNIMVDNQTDLAIIRNSQIYHHVMKFNDGLSEDTLNKFEHIINLHKKKPKQYPVYNYSDELTDWATNLQEEENTAQLINTILGEYVKELKKDYVIKKNYY